MSFHNIYILYFFSGLTSSQIGLAADKSSEYKKEYGLAGKCMKTQATDVLV